MRQIEAIDRVTALGRAILQRVFPDFLVVVLLLFVPWRAGGEVESLPIGGPGESVHFFFALGHRKRFPTIGRDEVELRDTLGIVFLRVRSEEHTSELQSRFDLVCRLLLEKKK